MRILLALFLIAYSTVLCAEKRQSYWQAAAITNSCTATLDMTNAGSSEPIWGVYIVFIIPNPDFDGYEVNLLKGGEPRLLMIIQPFIRLTDEDNVSVASKVTVETKKKTYKRPSDTRNAKSDFQSFLLGGKLAQEIWDQIVAKEAV